MFDNVKSPALSTVPSAVPVMPGITSGNGPLIVNDSANDTWIGPALLTVAPAGRAVNSTVPAVKATDDPTTAASVPTRLGLKRRIYPPEQCVCVLVLDQR
jgi:hypothetical protein